MATVSPSPQTSLDLILDLADILLEISLNGGIVSNKGFIRQFAPAGTKIIEGKYISAWGGIQSAGQTIGQVVSSRFWYMLRYLSTNSR